jgi:hypothetical protein
LFSQLGHECHGRHPNKTVGVTWSAVNEHVQAAVCVSKADQTIPLWVTYREGRHGIDRRVDFKTFIPKNPADR